MGRKLKVVTIFLMITLPVITLVLVGAEVFLRVFYPGNMEQAIAPVQRIDPDLGYSGIPNAEGIDSLKLDGQLKYRVKVKLNKFGFRDVPGSAHAEGNRCILLLGDSEAFGIGVNVEDTVAGLLQARLKKSRVINLGFTGFGPHQTLRLLELGRERPQLEGCREVKAYYLGIEDNFWRALGRASWGMSSPKYQMVNGRLQYVGPHLSERLNRWNIAKYRVGFVIVNWWIGYGKEVSPQEHQVYIEIFRKIGRLLGERYAADLQVVYFTLGQDPRWPKFRKLEAPGLAVRYFENFARQAGFAPDKARSELYLPDGVHINEAGNRLLADLLLREDLKGW